MAVELSLTQQESIQFKPKLHLVVSQDFAQLADYSIMNFLGHYFEFEFHCLGFLLSFLNLHLPRLTVSLWQAPPNQYLSQACPSHHFGSHCHTAAERWLEV